MDEILVKEMYGDELKNIVEEDGSLRCSTPYIHYNPKDIFYKYRDRITLDGRFSSSELKNIVTYMEKK